MVWLLAFLAFLAVSLLVIAVLVGIHRGRRSSIDIWDEMYANGRLSYHEYVVVKQRLVARRWWQ